jgi:hypothetical protein
MRSASSFDSLSGGIDGGPPVNPGSNDDRVGRGQNQAGGNVFLRIPHTAYRAFARSHTTSNVGMASIFSPISCRAR